MADSEVTIKVGFGDSLRDLTVRLPDGEIPPYQPSDQLDEVGKSRPRLDAVAKVTGRAKYAYDQRLPGMLYGKILRSPHPNADIRSVDLSAAKAMPGVRAAISFPEAFRTNSVRYAWQGVAAVAADTEEQAIAALEKIAVEYEPRPFSVTLESSMSETSPQVGRGDQTNVEEIRSRRQPRGHGSEEEVQEKLAKAAHRVSGTFQTQVHTHSPLETHGSVCAWENGQLVCYASTQGTFSVKQELERSTGADRVRVLSEYVGGGFGSKFGAGTEGVAGALLAKEAGRPVKLMLDRKEEQTDAGNRPDSLQKITLGVDDDGKVQAYHVETWGTPGAGTRGAGANNDVIYDLGLIFKRQYGVRTNTGGARALRAPGWPQGVFALESMMDMAAAKIGMDPIEFRKKNDFHPIRIAEYDMAKKLIGWDERYQKKPGTQKGTVKTGLGVGTSIWFAAGGRGARVRVRIQKNGAVEVRNGAQDIGTGTRTIMGMVVAEELGLDVTKVKTFIGDTDDPAGPGSGGSTTAPTLTPVARLAAYRAKEALLQAVAESRGLVAEELDLRGGQVVRKDGRALSASISFAQACGMIVEDEIDITESRRPNFEGLTGTNAGVQIAEVSVDTKTGEVRVPRVVAIADCGKLINPKLAESQVRGGVIQGVSYALFERRIMDSIEGRMVNADFENYKILGAADCPHVDVEFLDVYMGRNNTNVMGLGEPPIVATAAAVANAVHNAIGVRITSLPITPKKVLAALAEKEARG